MKSASAIVATLRDRDLEDLADTVARRHGQKLLEVCTDIKTAEIVEARHAVWYALYKVLGYNASAVARIWGADDPSWIATVLRDYPPEIVRVVLDRFPDTDEPRAELLWVAGRVHPFGVADHAYNSAAWFATYDEARNVFRETCVVAGDVATHWPAMGASSEGGV